MRKRTERYSEYAVPIVIALSLGLQLIGSLVLSAVGLEGDTATFVGYLVPQLAFLIAVFGYSLTAGVNLKVALPLAAKTFDKKKLLLAPILAIGLFFTAWLPNILIMTGFGAAGLTAEVTIPEMSSARNIVLGIFIICFLPAIGEELVFRGVTVGGLYQKYGGVTALLLGGAFFSLFHANLAQTVYQFAFGALVCWIYIKTQSLLFCMLMHFVNNLLAVFVGVLFPVLNTLALNGESMAILVPSFIIGAALFGASLYALMRKTPPMGKGERKGLGEAPTVTLIALLILWLATVILANV